MLDDIVVQFLRDHLHLTLSASDAPMVDGYQSRTSRSAAGYRRSRLEQNAHGLIATVHNSAHQRKHSPPRHSHTKFDFLEQEIFLTPTNRLAAEWLLPYEAAHGKPEQTTAFLDVLLQLTIASEGDQTHPECGVLRDYALKYIECDVVRFPD
jgi:hypothetical protein